MKKNVSLTEITNQLVSVFSNPAELAVYNSTAPQYDGICGWCGVMSPLSRPAFLVDFGEALTVIAENKAREIIKERNEAFARSEYSKHAHEADTLEGVPAVGGFFWAYCSGLKQDGGRGLFGELYDFMEYTDKKPAPRLCKVAQVFNVSAEEFARPSLADELTEANELEGGCKSDDIDENRDYFDVINDKEALKTFYTVGALVVAPNGSYYLIDTEGYHYARYIYFPTNYKETLRNEVAQVRKEIADAKAKAEAEAKAAKDARRREYVARCQKWEKLMQDVRPLEEAEKKARKAYDAIDWRSRKGSKEEKAVKAAERKTMNTQKANILAMCRAAFPGVKFSVTVHKHWGADWVLTWQDGPTLEEFNEKTDLGLFCSRWDTFDGMTDSADVEYAEFMEFSSLAMGSNSGNVKTEREASKEATDAILTKLFAVCPECNVLNKYGYYDRYEFNGEQVAKVCEALNVGERHLFTNWQETANEIAHRAWNETSYTPAQPTEPTTPEDGGKAQKVAQADEVGEVLATREADGLQLVTLGEGVAVVETRRNATYKARKEIRANGGDWNREAKQWQALNPDDVAKLREWFGLSNEESQPQGEAVAETTQATETATEGETVAEVDNTPSETENEPQGEEMARSYIVAITYDSETKKTTITRTQAKEGNNINDIAERMAEYDRKGDYLAFDVFDDFHGITICFRPNAWTYKMLFAEVLPVGQRLPEYETEREQLKQWTTRTTERTHDETKPAECQAGGVWQFVQKLASGEELHEIRNRGDWFELVVNICDRFGGGQRFPDKFATYAAAFEALQRFRPGSRLWSSPAVA